MPTRIELAIKDRQRVRRLNKSWLMRFGKWLLRDALEVGEAEIGIHFVGADEIARVHWEFMSIRGPTDVITFDHGSQPPRRIHGEIFICVEIALGQADEFATTWQSELARYLIHGVLHLLGYGDLTAPARSRMKREENRLLKLAQEEFTFAKLEKT